MSHLRVLGRPRVSAGLENGLPGNPVAQLHPRGQSNRGYSLDPSSIRARLPRISGIDVSWLVLCGVPSGAGAIPAAGAIAINLVPGRRHCHSILELDEAAARMQQRGLDRNHHAGFERPLRVIGVIRHRPRIGEPRRLVAHQPHAMGEEFVVVVQVRFLQHRLGRRINLNPIDAGTDRLERGLLGGLDFGEQILKFGVGFAGDAHAREITDIAVIIAA